MLKDLGRHSWWIIYYKFVSQSSWIVFQRWQEYFGDQRFISAERFKCKFSTLVLSNTVFPHTATHSWNQLSGYSKIARELQNTSRYSETSSSWNLKAASYIGADQKSHFTEPQKIWEQTPAVMRITNDTVLQRYLQSHEVSISQHSMTWFTNT